MAPSITKSNTFTDGTTARADFVDQNFDEMINFINAYAVTTDGAKSYTTSPAVPAGGPTLSTHLIHQTYGLRHPKWLNSTGFLYGTGPLAQPVTVRCGIRSDTTDSLGRIGVTFGTPFVTGVLTILINLFNMLSTADVWTTNAGLSGFTFNTAFTNNPFTFSWIALGK